MLGVCRVITKRITGSMLGHHRKTWFWILDSDVGYTLWKFKCSSHAHYQSMMRRLHRLNLSYMSESRIQNHESGHIRGQNSESKVMSWSSLDLGVGQRDWFDPSLMIYDSGFWIFLVERPPRAESRAVLKAVVGPDQISTSCLRIQNNSASASDKFRQLALNRRCTQNQRRIQSREVLDEKIF